MEIFAPMDYKRRFQHFIFIAVNFFKRFCLKPYPKKQMNQFG